MDSLLPCLFGVHILQDLLRTLHGAGGQAGLGWQEVLSSPRLGQGQLDSLGSIQKKIIVCAWGSCSPLLREPVSLAKESCSRAVVEPDPAVLGSS